MDTHDELENLETEDDTLEEFETESEDEASGDAPQIDWEKRYKDAQAELTRTKQQLAQPDLADGEEDEYSDPYSMPDSDIVEEFGLEDATPNEIALARKNADLEVALRKLIGILRPVVGEHEASAKAKAAAQKLSAAVGRKVTPQEAEQALKRANGALETAAVALSKSRPKPSALPGGVARGPSGELNSIDDVLAEVERAFPIR